ncbi:MAG: hypothetical protein PHE79_09640 [Eubacteriales bacterium]|nr:hypothetical protein [Eubacteriales bacterium]
MNGYYYLNFADLSEEAQQQLIDDAIADLEESEGKVELKKGSQGDAH